MIRFEPRSETPVVLLVMMPVISACAALALALVILAFIGAPAERAAGLLLQGAAGSVFALTETLTRATPLIFTGLAAAVAFRAKLWNIGAEGQLYAGALAAAAVGSGAITLPPYLMIPLICLAGAAAGALALLGPVLLKARLSVDEVVTTLLFNFIILLFVQMMLEGPMKDPMGMGWPQTAPIIDEGMLPKLIAQMRLHAGILIALGMVVLVHVLINRTVLGFEMRAVGGNASAARFAGIPVTATLVKTGLISGALAGLAGVSEVAGLKGYLTSDLSPGFGYSGIVVAMLAALNPLAVAPSAIFIAGVLVGADTMSRSLGISSYFADLVVSLALLSVLIGSLFTRYRLRWIRAA
ncbi:MAG: ABC transporter permease [Methylocystis sp.]|nr:ABC transporter permease [Methylocystis sp.]MCA3589788.1 ABC transporter permease [Methylocystis sp.]MCA3591568.1 ABC transporter permease [Methylocystis sp.]